MRNRIWWAVCAAGALIIPATVAQAVDQPISAGRLSVRRGPLAEKFAFISTDPALLFPAIGSADDPTQGGAVVEVFSSNDEPVRFTIPPGTAWHSTTRTHATYRFHNVAAPAGPTPVARMVIRSGARLQVAIKSAGLTLTAPASFVAIRVTTGALRNCARFGPSDLRANDTTRLLADATDAPPIADCSDASLLGTTPCGTPGIPVCGGDCPDGSTCQPAFIPLSAGGGFNCQCLARPRCDNGFGFGGAPEEGFPFSCYPLTCSGTYPACSTTCGDGGTCSPFTVNTSTVALCVCASAAACDDTARGFVCPTGQHCNAAIDGHRSCQ